MTLALTQSAQADARFRYHRNLRAKDYAPVPHRWYQVLALHLSGKSPKEVMEITGYSPAMYYRILDSPAIQAVRQQLMKRVQDEFDALYSKVVDNLTTQLNHTSPLVQLKAQEQWFKASGKYAPKAGKGEGEELSAEDLVQKLLMQQINVNVNLGGKVDAPTAIDAKVTTLALSETKEVAKG